MALSETFRHDQTSRNDISRVLSCPLLFFQCTEKTKLSVPGEVHCRTIRWLSWRHWSHSQQCLSLLRVTADANELLSHPFDPGIKRERNERHFKKRGKCPKTCPEEKINEKTKEEISIGVTFSMSIHLTTPEFPSRSPTLVPWGYSLSWSIQLTPARVPTFVSLKMYRKAKVWPFHWGIKCCLRLVIFAFLFLGFENSSTFFLGSGHVQFPRNHLNRTKGWTHWTVPCGRSVQSNFEPVEARSLRSLSF